MNLSLIDDCKQQTGSSVLLPKLNIKDRADVTAIYATLTPGLYHRTMDTKSALAKP
jgi:hypothetical protein